MGMRRNIPSGTLTQVWGLEWDADQVLMDINPAPACASSSVEPFAVSHPAPNNFRRDDLLMTRLDTLIMPYRRVPRLSGGRVDHDAFNSIFGTV